MTMPLTLTRSARIGLWLGLLSFNPVAQAVHLDVEVWGEPNALFAGFCHTPNVVGCDLDGLTSGLNLPQGTLPVEANTGQAIFVADFRDLPGGSYKTKNPGFQSIQNALGANEPISYRALGAMQYWPLNGAAWQTPPADTQITLSGGLDLNAGVFNNPAQCNGQLLCVSGADQGTGKATIFTGAGVQGAPELLIDTANNQGSLHTHLSFFLENAQGQAGGSEGAYLIQMQVFSRLRSNASAPFWVLFNAGLPSDQFTAALSALIKPVDSTVPPPVVNTPEPIPPVNNTPAPTLLPGDADRDGDVDRVDVALILLAAQKDERAIQGGDTRDMNGDGLITREDATLAKAACTLRLCNIPVTPVNNEVAAAPAVFNPTAKTLTINQVKVADQHYQVQLSLQPNQQFALQAAVPEPKQATQGGEYLPETGQLDIPLVHANQRYYQARLRNRGGFQFQLEQLQEIEATSSMVK